MLDHELKVTCEGEAIDFTVKEDSREFNPRSPYWYKIHSDGGTIEIKNTGVNEITLDPVAINVSKDGKYGFTFRELRLIPVGEK